MGLLSFITVRLRRVAGARNTPLELSGHPAEKGEGFRGRGVERKSGSCKS